jgi:hypothetical protein
MVTRQFLVDAASVREVAAGSDTGSASGLDLGQALPVLAVAGAVAGIRFVAGGSWLIATLGGMALTLVAGALLGCRVCAAPGAVSSIRCGQPCPESP